MFGNLGNFSNLQRFLVIYSHIGQFTVIDNSTFFYGKARILRTARFLGADDAVPGRSISHF